LFGPGRDEEAAQEKTGKKESHLTSPPQNFLTIFILQDKERFVNNYED
jgi:hypothetical protein